MPLYTFICKKCNKEFEVLKKIKDKDIEINCPSDNCDGNASKTIDNCNFALKGRGFYTTDNIPS